ncbi:MULTISPECIES: HalOD1 output domain-containing protein [Haloferax]|uniref:HalOD1 output domain-containing protein n=1 Tax=Haloferax sp. Atlit-48N TaxID=2077198 RepID=A0ACD5I021_9EURY|nr:MULTISPECIES: HalOD1 output domain-containing protein [Haloferax]RDZ30273.1 hypothetical protein DEQ67_14450 [Haloferax sp. Atlit-48N]RDZ33934.1 hypothetical protein C5B88_14775 [Haloferax sp. Atlit-24N]RDZ35601.1 hypothetical protein C5B89_17810 [Haloferax sp. Atlit-47N]RLM33539.1 hypothetical protein DVK03_17840 [Haloferax sp. Atlit-109R]RLM40883.1 hypothetical protein DVK04_18480 [Haloferax sp. Atlit-105R]
MDAVVSGIGVEAVEYHLDSTTVRAQFNQEYTPASMGVIAMLAEVIVADPVELDLLHSTVDPDALDALVRDGLNGEIHVTFTHEGRAITEYSYGVVTIPPTNESKAGNYKRNLGR